MDNKFTYKVIRSFMEEYMKRNLLYGNYMSYSELFATYRLADKTYPPIKTVDDEIDFINALVDYLGKDYCFECSDYRGSFGIKFLFSPRNRTEWDEAMNKIECSITLNKKVTQLKPCPFCGEKPTLLHPDEEGEDYVIGCYNKCCGFSYERARDTDKQKVIDAWNTRSYEQEAK